MRDPWIIISSRMPVLVACLALTGWACLAAGHTLAAQQYEDASVSDSPADSLAVHNESALAKTSLEDTTKNENITITSTDDDQPYYLIPELKGAGLSVSEGKRKFRRRFSFSPGYGQLGAQTLFAFRLAYNPNSWLGYEIALGHNPTTSVHALFHTFNVLLRYPLPWRAQPYGSLGYGMMTVFPGQAINADPVTKNTLTAGLGLELYLRDDVALRGEIRNATVLGRQEGVDGTVAWNYREYTIGIAFYRSLGG
jgi:hypothetical protein